MSYLNRRAFLSASTAAGLTVALSACGGDSEEDAQVVTEGQLSGEVTLTTWGSDNEIAAFEKIAADFKAQRGASVRIEVLPYDQMRTVVDRRLQADDAPDLFRVGYTDINGYAKTGVLVDLTDYLDSDFSAQFLPGLWEACSFEGVPIGVPHHTDTSALAYNKSHFEKAGITDVPDALENAWTWEELTEVLVKLKDANPGSSPFAFNYQLFGAYRWFNTLFQGGGTVLNEDFTAANLDTPEARRALEFTQGLYTDGLHAPSVLVKRPTYPDAIFPTEKISMIQTGDFLIPSLDEAIGDKFEWGVTYLPQDVGEAADLGGNAVVVTEQAKNKGAAIEFAKFLVTKENMQYFCEQTTVLPVREDLVDAELAYGTRPDLMPVFQQQATTMPEALIKTSVLAGFPAINQALIDNMDQYLSDPSASTDSVVQGLTSSIENAL